MRSINLLMVPLPTKHLPNTIDFRMDHQKRGTLSGKHVRTGNSSFFGMFVGISHNAV
ncbi:MAG TPA: hypothetical protein PK765_07800 [bacterium]|nr:hypothetical protein [bacterium]